MKMESFAGIAVTAMIIILMVVSVLVPMIQNTDTTTYVDSDNEGYAYKMSMGDGTYSGRITIASIGEGSVTYTIGAAGSSTGTSKILSGDQTLTWLCDNSIVTATSTVLHVINTNVGAGGWNLDAAGDFVEWNAGTMTATHDPGTEGEGSRTSPYTWVLHEDANGSFAWFDGSFNISKAVKAYAIWWGNNGLNAVAGYGTASNMYQVVGASSVSSTWTVAYSEEGTYNAVTGATVTYVGSSTVSGSALGFIAPISYTSGTDGNGSIVTTLLDIIPILIIVGIILAIVGLYFRGRDY